MTCRRRSGDRGAVLVEFALLLTFFAIVLFGVVEFGMAWQDKMTVESGARAGARVGANLGAQRLADYAILQGVRAALNDVGIGNVDYVVVYKADSGGAVPAACAGAVPTSQANLCNVYSGTQLGTLAQSNFGGTTSCSTVSPDRFWCPLSRQDIQSAGTDYVGIWIKAQHPMLTGFFGSRTTLTSAAVMRIEPNYD